MLHFNGHQTLPKSRPVSLSCPGIHIKLCTFGITRRQVCLFKRGAEAAHQVDALVTDENVITPTPETEYECNPVTYKSVFNLVFISPNNQDLHSGEILLFFSVVGFLLALCRTTNEQTLIMSSGDKTQSVRFVWKSVCFMDYADPDLTRGVWACDACYSVFLE